ncbi:DUF2892 domain-containing protein [Thermodesulfobacteriota bacterium]
MYREKWIRLMVGTYIIISLALGLLVSPYWFLFAGLVALVLIQSVFTNWCPCEQVLKKIGIKEKSDCSCDTQ